MIARHPQCGVYAAAPERGVVPGRALRPDFLLREATRMTAPGIPAPLLVRPSPPLQPRPSRNYHRSGAYPASLSRAAVAAACLAAACTDEHRLTAPGVAERAPVASLARVAGLASAGFDPSDSYASYEIETVRRYTTMPRAGAAGAAGRASTVTRPRERTRVEFGYDDRGRERMVMTLLVDSASAGVPVQDRIGRVALVDGEVQVYGLDGTRLDSKYRQGLPGSASRLPAVAPSAGPAANFLDGIRAPAGLVARAASQARIATSSATSGSLAAVSFAGGPSGTATLVVRRDAGAGNTNVREFDRAPDGSYQLARTHAARLAHLPHRDLQTSEDAIVTVLAVREVAAREARRRVGGGTSATSAGGAARPTDGAPCPQATLLGQLIPAVCLPPSDPPPDDPPPPTLLITPVNFVGLACNGFQFCPPPGGAPGIPICDNFGFTAISFCNPPQLPPFPSPPPFRYTLPAVGLVFEHGFESTPSTWSYMTQTFAATFYGTPMISNSRVWQNPIAQQAADEASSLQGAPEYYYVYIGHSMGGLVARDVYHRMLAAKVAGARATIPFGVITIGTPHLGTPLALQVPTLVAAVSDALSGAEIEGCSSTFFVLPSLCLAIARGGEYAQAQLTELARAPSLPDLAPRSGYINARNATPDAFVRAAIESSAPPRWIMFRVAGDATGTCGPESSFCNGAAAAGAVNAGYASLRAIAITQEILGIYPIADAAKAAADYLDHVDAQWSIYTTQGDPDTDGIVPGRSQQYPNQGLYTGPNSALRQIMIGPGSGPSHVGETGSRDVINATSDLLDVFFNIRSYPRQVP